jgi:hypothetical protein
MKIIENTKGFTGKFDRFSNDDPVLELNNKTIWLSKAAQKLLGVNAGDKVLFAVDNSNIFISVLPNTTEKKGFKVMEITGTKNLMVSSVVVSRSLDKKGFYRFYDELTNIEGFDWFEFSFVK